MRDFNGISMLAPAANMEQRGINQEDDAPEEWTRIGAAWSAIEPADSRYGVDSGLVTAIRRIDPAFVPLWLTTEHQSPSGGIVRCVHLAIAWRLTTPHKKHQARQVIWPTSKASVNYGMGGYPVFVEEILQGQPTPSGPAFKPLSWDDLERIKHGVWLSKHDQPSDEEYARREIQAMEDRKAKEDKRLNDEINYRVEHEASGAQPHFDAIGSADIRTWGAPKESTKAHVEVK